MKILYNPNKGADIKNFKACDSRYYSINIGEKGQYQDDVARHLKETYDFLIYVDYTKLKEESASIETELSLYEEKDMNIMDVGVIIRRRDLLKRKEDIKNILHILKDSSSIKKETGNEDIPLEEMSRGALVVKCRDIGYTDTQLKRSTIQQLISMVKEKI